MALIQRTLLEGTHMEIQFICKKCGALACCHAWESNGNKCKLCGCKIRVVRARDDKVGAPWVDQHVMPKHVVGKLIHLLEDFLDEPKIREHQLAYHNWGKIMEFLKRKSDSFMYPDIDRADL